MLHRFTAERSIPVRTASRHLARRLWSANWTASAPALGSVAGDKYSYRELDAQTEKIEKSLKTIPQVSKVNRSGVVSEQVELLYSQERLASYGISANTLKQALSARNISMPGGMVNAGGRNLPVAPTGEFQSEKEIGDVLVSPGAGGRPAYVRDLVEVYRGYESPARFFHFYNWRDAAGHWRRSRAITLDIQMRARRADRRVRRSGRCQPGRSAEAPAGRSGHGAHLGPAAAGHAKTCTCS